jgi:hypothetical protein
MSFRKVILSSLVPATETIIGVLKNNKDVVVIVLTSAQLNSHASQLKLQKQKKALPKLPLASWGELRTPVST